MKKRFTFALLFLLALTSLFIQNNSIVSAKTDTNSIANQATEEYLVRDGFYSLNDSSVNRMSSEHFQIIWGKNDTTGKVTTELVRGNLTNLENIRSFYLNELGMKDPCQSMTNAISGKYKTNLYISNTGLSQQKEAWAYMSTDSQGFAYMCCHPNALRVDPPSWVVPHEYAHVITYHQGGIIVDGWYETLANWFRDQYLGSSYYRYGNNVYGPDADFFGPYLLNAYRYFPHNTNYYDAWPMFLYISDNPDQLSGLGKEAMKALITTKGLPSNVFEAIEKVTHISKKDILGRFARRMVTLDFKKQALYQKRMQEWLATDVSYKNQIYTSLQKGSDGYWEVPLSRAPQQGGYNIIPLNVDLNGSSIAIDFQGTSTYPGSDWRVSIVTVTNSGKTRYSSMWSKGTNRMELHHDEKEAYLVVSATPDTMESLTCWDANANGKSYPYKIKVVDSEAAVDHRLDGTSNIAILAKASTSYCSSWETIAALNDGFDPTNSADHTHGAYGNWPETASHWVQYTFEKPHKIYGTRLYWFKDGHGIDVPASYEIQYLDNNNNFVPVNNAQGLTSKANQYNTTVFTPITTKAIRVKINPNLPYSSGILEWQVFGE